MRLAADHLLVRIQIGAILLMVTAVLALAGVAEPGQQGVVLAGALGFALVIGAAVCWSLRRQFSSLHRLSAQLRLAASVVENTSEGVMVVDADGRIVSVNPAFTRITGYSAAEAVGKTPSILRSEHHDDAFYRELLQRLLATGSWQGEVWHRRKDGEIYPEWLSINLIPEDDGIPASYVAVFADVTEHRQKDERIRHLAFHDALTGLPNRSLLFDRLQHAVLIARRERHRLAVMFLDLDRFKNVNDNLGHEVGDLLLQEVAKRLCAGLRGTDTVARMGGDEFVILLEELADPEDAAEVAANLIAEISKPQEIAGYVIEVGASVGIAVSPDDGDNAIELMKYADTAMYAAKAAGKGVFRFFHAGMTEQAAEHLQLESELRRAVERGELELHFLPEVGLADGTPLAAEALLRWRHPRRGLVLPEAFLGMAEETGLIAGVGDWVLAAACRQLAEWQRRGVELVVAVNVSARQLQAGDLAERIRALAAEHGFAPAGLRIELAESVAMSDPARHAPLLARLRDIGIGVAIDDFGTGFSSLAYLRRLPIDTVKIDRSFVARAVDDEGDAQVIRSILALGRSLELAVVAEGVESEAQADMLRATGCQVGQGFLFARPAPAAECGAWLTKALSQT